MNDVLERILLEAVVVLSRYYAGIFRYTEENHGNLSQKSRFPESCPKRTPPEYCS
jgi:hypothetical protein